MLYQLRSTHDCGTGGLAMDFQPTGIQKSDYLDLIEKVVDAYGTELLEKQLELEE